MYSIKAVFTACSQSPFKQFQLRRSVKKPIANVIFVQGFFEELNQNRHVFTRLAEQLAAERINNVIYDHIGTGDSEGNLSDVSLTLWREQLIELVSELKHDKKLPVLLIVFGSGALLLSDKIAQKCDYIQLWQPEINGKRMLKQLMRIALLNNMPIDENDDVIDASGYPIPASLWQAFKSTEVSSSVAQLCAVEWLECVDDNQQEMPLARKKSALSLLEKDTNVIPVSQVKYWQANELIHPDNLLHTALTLVLQQIPERA